MTHDLFLLLAARIGCQTKLAQVEALISAAQTGSQAAQPQQRKVSAIQEPAQPAKRKKGKMSAAGRKRIGDATKKRWAEWREANGKSKGAAA
jgi:hypothetical protein